MAECHHRVKPRRRGGGGRRHSTCGAKESNATRNGKVARKRLSVANTHGSFHGSLAPAIFRIVIHILRRIPVVFFAIFPASDSALDAVVRSDCAQVPASQFHLYEARRGFCGRSERLDGAVGPSLRSCHGRAPLLALGSLCSSRDSNAGAQSRPRESRLTLRD